MLARAQERQSAHDGVGSLALARRALELDPDYVEAMEMVANALITRQRRYVDGVALVDRMMAVRADDAGLWYAAGWLYEFAAHEIKRRRPDDAGLDVRDLYERAAAAFRRCLSLGPEPGLRGDAEDLLDHVENELA